MPILDDWMSRGSRSRKEAKLIMIEESTDKLQNVSVWITKRRYIGHIHLKII